MKKKVKKIPKYKEGTPFYNDANFYSQVGDFSMQQVNNILQSKLGVTAGGIAKGALSGAAAGAVIGSIIPGIGTAAGAVGGALVGGITSSIGSGSKVNTNSSSTHFNEIYTPGSGIASLFDDDAAARIGANMVQNNNIAKIQTEQMRAKYAMNPNNPNGGSIMAAEGGIMRQPVNALVSPGEIAINPYTLEYRQFGSDNEEPNSKDNIETVLERGDNVKSHAKHMIMPNGKTPADNSKMVLDSNMPEEMKRKMIKKIDNWESAHRTKPQEYAKFDNGGIVGINKYRYNKNMSDFAYWDKDKNEYKKEYLDWVNNLTEQDVRDIEAGKYGDMTEYFSKNKGKKLDVATAQKLMTDKKYGNWHKIGQAVVDTKVKNNTPLVEKALTRNIVGTNNGMWQTTHPYDAPIKYNVMPMDKPTLKKLANPSEADGVIAARKYLSKQNTPNWLDEMSNLLPVIGGLFDKYDWHTELSQITPPRFVPVNADPRPLLRAADESSSIGNYNLANMGVGTGAYIAHSALLASDRAKRYADAHRWQQETNNKLIAQNAGIYNDWRKQRDAYATQAIADTRANEGAAQQMGDQARKDRLEFYYGKRNDDMSLAALSPLAQYVFDDNTYRKIYKRGIV